MALRILIEDSEGKSKFAPIDPGKSEITIGRNPGNFIRLKEQNVSRNHAKIYTGQDGQLYIEPVAARYGLKVNSSKINGPTVITLGDEIKIGDYRLYIQDENQPEVHKDDDSGQVVDIEPALQPRFVVISSNFAGREYHVVKSRVQIGRNPTSDIQIQHQSVSGEHAEVRRNARGEYEIRDLNSSNGTKINGIPIQEPYILNSGDAITLGHVTMRYCAPGDFWSLNFGINDEPQRQGISLGMLIIVLAVFFALIIGMMMYVVHTLKDQPQQNAQQSEENAQKSDKEEFENALFSCKDAMSVGQFESAKLHCDKAQSILPDDPRYLAQSDQLAKEISANNSLNEILTFIDAGRCRDAIDGISKLDKNTWAGQQMLNRGIKAKANSCLEQLLYRRAMDSIDNEDFADAELARDEIEDFKSNSEYIVRINDALKKAKGSGRAPSKPDGGTGKRKPSGNSADPAPAPAPSRGPDVEELCAKAVKAKMSGNKCEAYKLYRKAKDAGIKDPTCERNAKNHIAAYAAECNK